MPPYILPVFPTISIILGYFFGFRWTEPISAKEVVTYIVLFALVGVSGFVAFSGGIEQYVKDPRTVDIIKGMKNLEIGLAIISGAIMGILCFKRMRRHGPLFVLLVGFSLSLVTLIMWHTNILDSQRTTKALAEIVNRYSNPSTMLVTYHSYEQTLPFYTRRRVHIVDFAGELEMGSKYADAKGFFLTEKEFQALLESGKPVFCILKQKRREELAELTGRKLTILTCKNERCLASNQPHHSGGP